MKLHKMTAASKKKNEIYCITNIQYKHLLFVSSFYILSNIDVKDHFEDQCIGNHQASDNRSRQELLLVISNKIKHF